MGALCLNRKDSGRLSSLGWGQLCAHNLTPSLPRGVLGHALNEAPAQPAQSNDGLANP